MGRRDTPLRDRAGVAGEHPPALSTQHSAVATLLARMWRAETETAACEFLLHNSVSHQSSARRQKGPDAGRPTTAAVCRSGQW